MDDIKFETDYVSSSTPSGYNMEVDPGVTVRIYWGRKWTIGGSITNNGTIQIKYDAALVQTSAGSDENINNGTYEVERRTGTLVDDSRIQLWSSPVQQASMGTVFSGSSTSDFYFFNESNQTYVNQSPSSYMTVGKGYTATGTLGLVNNNQTRTFSDDKINNGDISLSVNASNDDHILIGNPYPSAIHIATFQSDNPNLYGTVYFWNHSTDPASTHGANIPGDYAAWNASGGVANDNDASKIPNGSVSSCQGFFVQASAPVTAINFKNSQRVNSDNSQFFKNDSRERFWLSLTTEGGVSNQILIARIEDATDGFDYLFDGAKFQGNPDLAFYSLIGNDKYCIQAVGKSSNDQIIPLGINSNITETMTFSLDTLAGWETSRPIYLYDAMLDESYDLRITDYTFQWSFPGEVNDRFYLTFSSLGLGINEGSEGTKWSWYQLADELVINSSDVPSALTLRTVSGQVVGEVGNQATLNVADLASGVYVLEAKFNGISQPSIKKVVLQ